MIYPNLEAEMTRHSVTQADISRAVGKRAETINNWMNGRAGDFSIVDAIEVQRRFFPDCEIKYQFERQEAS